MEKYHKEPTKSYSVTFNKHENFCYIVPFIMTVYPFSRESKWLKLAWNETLVSGYGVEGCTSNTPEKLCQFFKKKIEQTGISTVISSNLITPKILQHVMNIEVKDFSNFIWSSQVSWQSTLSRSGSKWPWYQNKWPSISVPHSINSCNCLMYSTRKSNRILCLSCLQGNNFK